MPWVERRQTDDTIRQEIEQRLSDVIANHPAANRIIKERALAEIRAKTPTANELRQRLETVRATWPSLHERLGDFLLAEPAMRRWLADVGVATDPATLGISPAVHRATLLRARLIRRRYTILDFLHETGRLVGAVETLFATGGRPGSEERRRPGWRAPASPR